MTRHLGLEDLGPRGRAVVISPHPDDEVFGVGGLMASLEWAGYPVEVVAVTDGEASHASSKRITADQLRAIRATETLDAYGCLGIHPERFRLGLPDAAVSSHADVLRQMLAIRFAGASFVLSPLPTDGHPDHDASGRIALDVAESLGIPLWSYAVWAWLHPERITQGEPDEFRLAHEIQARKERAVDAFTSQFNPLGPLPEDGPVLPKDFRQHFVGEWEYLWRTS